MTNSKRMMRASSAATGLAALVALAACDAEDSTSPAAPAGGGKADDASDTSAAAKACRDAVPEDVPLMEVDEVFAQIGMLTGPVAISGPVTLPSTISDACQPIETSLGTICNSCVLSMKIVGDQASAYVGEECLYECGELVACSFPPDRSKTVWGTPVASSEDNTVFFRGAEGYAADSCLDVLCPSTDELMEQAQALIDGGELGGDQAYEVSLISSTGYFSFADNIDLNGDRTSEAILEVSGRFADSTFQRFVMVFASEGEHLCGQRFVGAFPVENIGDLSTFDSTKNGFSDVEVSSNGTLGVYQFDGDRYVLQPEPEVAFPTSGDLDAGECSDYAAELPVFSPTSVRKLRGAALGQEVAIRGSIELGSDVGGCTEAALCNTCTVPLVIRDEETTLQFGATCKINECGSRLFDCDVPLGQDEVVRGTVARISEARGTVQITPSDSAKKSCGASGCLADLLDRVRASTDDGVATLGFPEFGDDLDANGQPELFVTVEMEELEEEGFEHTFIFMTGDTGQCDQVASFHVPGWVRESEAREVHNGMLDLFVIELTQDRVYRFDGTDYRPLPTE